MKTLSRILQRTVTIAYQGELEHRDSSGGGGKIGPGDVQWMTAGAGTVQEEFHSPEFARRGGALEMVQLWVNLRAQDKSAQPGYQTLLNADIPEFVARAVLDTPLFIPIERSYPLAEAGRALAQLKAGRMRGKVILTVPQ